MTDLWIGISGLLFIAFVIVLLPLWLQNRFGSKILNQQSNIAIFKQRLQELELEYQQNEWSAEQFALLKTELQHNLLTDTEGIIVDDIQFTDIKSYHWIIGLSLGVLVILISLAMYADLGHSQQYQQYLIVQNQAKIQAQENEKLHQQIAQLITNLQKQLAANPKLIDRWLLLANSYAALERYAEAVNAYRQANAQMNIHDPNYAAVKGATARLLFQASGEKITDEVRQLVTETLSFDPLESSALILKGIDTYNQRNLPLAIQYWQQAKTKADANLLSGFIEPVLQQAQQQLAQMNPIKSVNPSSVQLKIHLTISNNLIAQLNPEQTVFIFAKSPESRMPLAVEKLQVKDLPATITLDDSKSPMPTATLSSAKLVDITARITLSGQVQANKGDWFGELKQIDLLKQSSVLELQINQQVN
ncbi:MAG: hypothetical protein RL637_1854 [Pseudomonadota bacterium]|jgi:cytochrome c-type biogenesis protein CcmH